MRTPLSQDELLAGVDYHHGSAKAHKVDHDEYLSLEARTRYPSPLKDLAARFLGIPGIINFGGGLPHAKSFPFSRMALHLPAFAEHVVVPNKAFAADAHVHDAHAVVGADGRAGHLDLAAALQYGGSLGAAQLRDFLKEHTRRSGGVAHDDWDLIISNGNTDAFDNAIRSLCTRGDSIIVESFCYPASLAALRPMGLNVHGVPMDGEGMLPRALDDALATWDPRTPKPRVMVIVPTGQNPTGATMSTARRRAIYAVARKHRLLIVCDDPYRHLRLCYDDAQTPPPPTFLSLDTDGRVVELSSFSKIVAPGLRCGWITAPAALVYKFSQRNEVTIQSSSGFSAATIAALFGAMGGQEGWEKYLLGVGQQYSTRAASMLRLFDLHLSPDHVEYAPPQGGMFVLVRVRAERLPHMAPDDVLERVFDAFIAHRVILTPSKVFRADDRTPLRADEVWFRASFSSAEPDAMEQGVLRMRDALTSVFST